MSLSTVIICQNEERNIRICIESALSFSDEIIIADGFSTDTTKAIATSFEKVKFYERTFDNYIDQKNFANSKVSSDYILSLDADEYAGEELTAFCQNRGYESHDAISLHRINYIGEQPILHGLWRNDRKIRIWKKSLGKWAGKLPHEHLELSTDSKLWKSNIQFYHRAFQSTSDLKMKSMKYADMAARGLSPRSPISLFTSLILNPTVKFLKGYIFNFGFLDGKLGWELAKISFLETYYKYKFALIKKWK